MKKNILIISSLGIITPTLAYAAVGDLIDSLTAILALFVPILLGIAVLVFFWGLVKFINHADDEKTLEEGKQLMIWGMIAIFVMVSLWGIIGWLQDQIGVKDATDLGTLWFQPDKIPGP